MKSVVWCFNGVDGCTYEFASLTEAKKEAIRYSKFHLDFEVCIYALTSLYYLNGKFEF